MGQRAVSSEQGVALPVVLIVLVLVASLTAAFVVLSSGETQVPYNLTHAVEVLSLAEAGLEDALWALSNPAAAAWNGFPTAAPPGRYNSPLPHDSSAAFVALGKGGYSVTIANGPGPSERTVTATGWIPNNTAPVLAKKVLTATLWSLKGRIDPPAALSVNGQLEVGGNSRIDAQASTCGTKLGTYTSHGTSIFGAARVYGGDGNSTANESTDYSQSQPVSSFDSITFSNVELSVLKAMAQANGTYYQGTQSFNSLQDGITFVDTVSGNPIGSPADPSDLASVTITGGEASGWLIVMGSLVINGNVSYTGLIYAANDIVYRGTGSGAGIRGAVISLNVVDPVSTAVDSDSSGNARVTFDCDAINTGLAAGSSGPPTVPQGYFVKPGTWREVSG